MATTDWSEEEYLNPQHTFSKSSIIIRTPPQTASMPAGIENAPTKKEPVMRLRRANASTDEEQTEKPEPQPTFKDLIQALEEAHAKLEKQTVKQKHDAKERRTGEHCLGNQEHENHGSTTHALHQPSPDPSNRRTLRKHRKEASRYQQLD